MPPEDIKNDSDPSTWAKSDIDFKNNSPNPDHPFPRGHTARQKAAQDWSVLANQVVGAEVLPSSIEVVATAQQETISTLRATVATLTAEKQRLFDLVRHQRGELHDAGLISNQEYLELAASGDSKKSVARLETYDELKAENERIKAEAAGMREFIQQWEPYCGAGFNIEALNILQTTTLGTDLLERLEKAEANYKLAHETLGGYVANNGHLLKQLATAEQRVEKMREVLNYLDQFYGCPCCMGTKKHGHDEGCKLAAALSDTPPIGWMSKTKIVTICGSSRFVAECAVKAWELNKQGIATFYMPMLPMWYEGVQEHHQAEHEGVAENLDNLWLQLIAMSDEVFVMNINGYIGERTAIEIAHAKKLGKPVKYEFLLATESTAARAEASKGK